MHWGLWRLVNWFFRILLIVCSGSIEFGIVGRVLYIMERFVYFDSILNIALLILGLIVKLSCFRVEVALRINWSLFLYFIGLIVGLICRFHQIGIIWLLWWHNINIAHTLRHDGVRLIIMIMRGLSLQWMALLRASMSAWIDKEIPQLHISHTHFRWCLSCILLCYGLLEEWLFWGACMR